MSQSAVYILQAISLCISFVGMVYMLKRKASFEQKLMLMVFVCFFLSNFGATIRMKTTTLESYEVATRIVNFGYAFPCFLYVIFVLRYLNKRVNPLLYWGMAAEAVCVSCISTFFLKTGIYYQLYDVTVENGFIKASRDNNFLFYFNLIFWAGLIFYAAVLLIIAITKCNDRTEKKKMIAVFEVALIGSSIFIIDIIMPHGGNDIMPFAMGAMSAFLVIKIETSDFLEIVASPREQMLESMPEAVFLFDDRMNISDVNASAIRLFPDIAECIGKKMPAQYTFLLENTDDMLSFKHNGVHFERQFLPIFYRNLILGYSLILFDVTHTHQILVQMRELKRRADIASASKSSFLANMSHEIRTPMNAIVGYADLIGQEVSTREGRTYAEAIKSSSNSLLHIINDILDFSKIEQGRLEIVEEEYVTERLFAEVNDIIQMQADKKGIKLICSVDPTTPAILYGDKVRIRQVLLNIAGNAVKFTHEGCVRIITEWECEEPDRAVLTIVVSDTGIGIAQENMNRLFEEFENVDIRTTVTKSGVGLGLSISKALLEMMGGTISLESEYGVGTSVVITIKQKIINRTPMASAGDLSGIGNDSKSKGALIAPDAKILVVDDNRVNLELMKNFLKQFRIIPDTALSGAESVKLASENYYDIVFMDQMMPEMDGVEAMKKIRATGGRNTALTIIALTANAIAGTRNALLTEGFTDYATKPLPIKTLEYLLTKYLPKGTFTISADAKESGGAEIVAEQLVSQHKVLELPDYIDQKVGLSNAGEDLAQYRSVIEIVHKYADEKISRIGDLLSKKDYVAYTIEVHALKSNAATVGAMKLADKARALETAGKSADFDTIERDSAAFLEEYRIFTQDLGKYLKHEEELDADIQEDILSPMIADREEYLQTFNEIGRAVTEKRFDDARDLFGVLEFFELTPDTAHAVKSMKTASEQGDWQTVLDIIEKLR